MKRETGFGRTEETVLNETVRRLTCTYKGLFRMLVLLASVLQVFGFPGE